MLKPTINELVISNGMNMPTDKIISGNSAFTKIDVGINKHAEIIVFIITRKMRGIDRGTMYVMQTVKNVSKKKVIPNPTDFFKELPMIITVETTRPRSNTVFENNRPENLSNNL